MCVEGVNNIYRRVVLGINEPNAVEHLAEFLDMAGARHEMCRDGATQFVSAFTYWLV